jgi:hypothetical protein
MAIQNRWSVEDLAREVTPIVRRLLGGARRMLVAATVSGSTWTIRGYDQVAERMPAEVFGGIGVTGRPPAGNVPEAVVVNVGGAEHPLVVALRDEKVRKAIEAAIPGGFPANAAALFNSLAFVYVTPAGAIEARTLGGVAVPLALKSDVDALASYIATDLTLPVTGATAGPIAAPVPPSAVGTTTLLGE